MIKDESIWATQKAMSQLFGVGVPVISKHLNHVFEERENMKTDKYRPQPIDTTGVKLPEELEQLVEQMSKNVHEVWAATRISQGWTYGKERNDKLKAHPCLVPYEELPEEEKEYDRNTSTSTLKLILKLGFNICK